MKTAVPKTMKTVITVSFRAQSLNKQLCEAVNTAEEEAEEAVNTAGEEAEEWSLNLPTSERHFG